MRYLISFPNVSQAMKCEAIFKGEGGELISLPEELDAGCGFAYLKEAEAEDIIRKKLNAGEVEFEKIIEWP